MAVLSDYPLVGKTDTRIDDAAPSQHNGVTPEPKAIVKAGELIERREFVDFVRESLDLGERFDLTPQLIADATDHRLLIDEVNAEDERRPNKRANRLIERERVGTLVSAQNIRKSK